MFLTELVSQVERIVPFADQYVLVLPLADLDSQRQDLSSFVVRSCRRHFCVRLQVFLCLQRLLLHSERGVPCVRVLTRLSSTHLLK